MEVDIRTVPATRIAGWCIEAPTERMKAEIQKLWTKAAKERFPSNVVGQIEPNTAATLTIDWFSEEPARFLLGTEVRTEANLPVGLVDQIFPESCCAIFTLGSRVPNLIEDWEGIWAWLDSQGEEWTRDVSLRRYDYKLRTGTITLPLR